MQAPTSTFSLVQRFQSGDSQAFSLLFEKYRGRLALLIHYKLSPELRSTFEVDDLLQETFLAAARDLAGYTYQSPGSFLRWLARIAEHVIIDAARSQDRKKRRPAALLRFRSPSNPEGPEPLDTRTPSRIFAQQEKLRALLERLNSLPEDYRQAILLTKVEGLSTHEMAERLGRSRESAALLLHRALKRFRELEARAHENE